MEIKCPKCGVEIKIRSSFIGKIRRVHCNKALFISGPFNNKKVELYGTSSFKKLKMSLK